MATVVNIHEAKTHFSKFVDEALGGLQGRIRVPDDFNAPLDLGVIAAFEGRS